MGFWCPIPLSKEEPSLLLPRAAASPDGNEYQIRDKLKKKKTHLNWKHLYLHSLLLTLQGGSTAASDPWGLSFMRRQSHQLNRYLHLPSPSFLLPRMCLQVVVEEGTEMHHPLRQRQTQAAQLTHTKGRRFCLHLKRPKRRRGVDAGGRQRGNKCPEPHIC